MLDSLTRYELQQVLIELWRKNKITALMVTHDVDEALFLSDRIVCMTDGPEAEVGDILEVHFPRPRERKAVMEHPDYYQATRALDRVPRSACAPSSVARPPRRPPIHPPAASPAPVTRDRGGPQPGLTLFLSLPQPESMTTNTGWIDLGHSCQ